MVVMGLVMQRQERWLKAIEKRIGATTAMLSSMKGVKMCGLTEILRANIHDLRVQELEISKGFRKLLIFNMGFGECRLRLIWESFSHTLAYLSPVFAPILTFAVFSILSKDSNGHTTLDTARAFTSLSLFALLTEPLQSLMMSLAMFMGAVGCFKRVQEFLDTASCPDTRRKPAYLEDSAGSDSEISSRRTSLSLPSQNSQKLSNAGLPDRTTVSASNLTVQRTGQSVEKLTLANYYQFSHSEAITITNGNFGWEDDKEPLLRDINIKIPRTKLTMVVGPVGSGKSTLLKGILGELPLTKGAVELSSLRVAFCDQTPWHMNGTIRESIVGASKFDERWYKSVIRGCALDEDLRQVANGDQTKIGSRGISLSGGQSQRIVQHPPLPLTCCDLFQPFITNLSTGPRPSSVRPKRHRHH